MLKLIPVFLQLMISHRESNLHLRLWTLKIIFLIEIMFAKRVLELLIIEKIKKSQAIKENIEYTEDELIEFAAMLYNFPKNQFDDFKLFITKENDIDLDVLMEQLSAELMWKKLLQKKFSSKIVINAQEIDKILADEKKKLGKYEYDLTEVFFENKKNQNWEDSKKN